MATLRLAPKAIDKIPAERIAAIPLPPKPAKVQKTPEEKAALLRAEQAASRAAAKRRRDANIVMHKYLCEQFPLAFNRNSPLPLMIGIDKAIGTALNIRPREVAATLAFWTRHPDYLRALIAGAARVDLDGNPVGVVTEEHQADAQAKLLASAARRAA